eukprot:258637-Chlamydomonas_euryale.AAC.1
MPTHPHFPCAPERCIPPHPLQPPRRPVRCVCRLIHTRSPHTSPSPQNVAHHLICSNRLDDLAELLTDPVWVEAKLHAYGVAAIVQDFRRCVA